MVVCEDGRMKRAEYRKFRVTSDGLRMPSTKAQRRTEPRSWMISPRWSRWCSGGIARCWRGGPFPDLILIDGGKGQLSAAYEALESLGPGEPGRRRHREEGGAALHARSCEPDRAGRDDPALLLLQRIRDEAHRFAVTFHRKARAKRDLRSELDGMPGHRPAPPRALLHASAASRACVAPRAKNSSRWSARRRPTPSSILRGHESSAVAAGRALVVRWCAWAVLTFVPPFIGRLHRDRAMNRRRVVSGMRPTGKLHLGHLVGALKNWVALQDTYECYYFVADWHALTSDYADTGEIVDERARQRRRLARRRARSRALTLFIQSLVPEHAELCLLLADDHADPVARARADLQGADRAAHRAGPLDFGFLGYPLLQTADVIIYNANFVPVGDDQVPHLELSREIVRRFNNFYGEVVRRAAGAADAGAAAARPRQPEDEQELRQHHRPVGRCGDGEEEGAADVHGSEADPRRHPRHGRGQPGVHLPRRLQPEHRRGRGPEGALSRRARSATSR